jgi:hypothetical protein
MSCARSSHCILFISTCFMQARARAHTHTHSLSPTHTDHDFESRLRLHVWRCGQGIRVRMCACVQESTHAHCRIRALVHRNSHPRKLNMHECLRVCRSFRTMRRRRSKQRQRFSSSPSTGGCHCTPPQGTPACGKPIAHTPFRLRS